MSSNSSLLFTSISDFSQFLKKKISGISVLLATQKQECLQSEASSLEAWLGFLSFWLLW
jgi:hypothetical protein